MAADHFKDGKSSAVERLKPMLYLNLVDFGFGSFTWPY